MQLDRYILDIRDWIQCPIVHPWWGLESVYQSWADKSQRNKKHLTMGSVEEEEERVMVVHLNNAILGRRVDWLWRQCLHAQICIAPRSIKLHCTE